MGMGKHFDWYDRRSLTAVAVAEFFGTLSLLVVVALANTLGGSLGPIAIGGGILCICGIIGDQSGTHLNPSITLALWAIDRRFTLARAATYCAAQFAGGIAGVQLGGWMSNNVHNSYSLRGLEINGFNFGQIFITEAFFSLLLVLVVLKAGFTHPTGNDWCPFLVAATVVSASYTAGHVSGACLNPAVGLGFTVACGTGIDLLVNTIAPFLGGLGACGMMMIFDPEIYHERFDIAVEWSYGCFGAKSFKKPHGRSLDGAKCDPETCAIENCIPMLVPHTVPHTPPVVAQSHSLPLSRYSGSM